MSDQTLFFQAGGVCSVDCKFDTDDSSLTGQCLGKEPSKQHSFSCDLIALSALYAKGAELERRGYIEALARKKEIRGQIE